MHKYLVFDVYLIQELIQELIVVSSDAIADELNVVQMMFLHSYCMLMFYIMQDIELEII